MQSKDQLQPIATGLLSVFENLQSEATRNQTSSQMRQPIVWLPSIVFSLVSVFFLVYATEPENTIDRFQMENGFAWVPMTTLGLMEA